MIVYRDRRRLEDTGAQIAGLLRTIRSWPLRPPHHATVDVLIRLGMLESAIADARHPDRDEEDTPGRDLRDASVAAGHLVRLSWRGYGDPAPWVDRLARRLEELRMDRLPPRIATEVPEGYAQYGLFPECYLDAAARCGEALGPGLYVCLGLRGIGSSLSAVVAAELHARGCSVRSYTLRPRGPPFERRIELGPRIAEELTRARAGRALVIDEGPGLSGSSMAGTAEKLGQLGFTDDRIVLLPSWDTDGSSLRSPLARRRWARHPRFVVGFEDTWLRSGRFEEELALTGARDVSAGAWRDELLPPDAPYLPVHPQHERRKFLAGRRLASFAGLGGIAERRAARATSLSAAGFVPPPLYTGHGFLVRTMAEGEPVRAAALDAGLVETMACYLAHLRCRQPADAAPPGDQLDEMIDVNVAEALGRSGRRMLGRHRRRWGRPQCDRPVAIDGRMQPHEWLRGPRGYLKVDALDHHDDHFLPGPCDIAWDLAGACVEFGLELSTAAPLMERYRRLSGDHTAEARLPAYTVAYAAFRTGYATMAAAALAGSPDGDGFRRLADRYRDRLRAELARPGGARGTA